MKKYSILVAACVLVMAQASAQNVAIPQIGVQAPSFKAQSTEGTINFPSDYGDHWKILLSHPKDFTPVCSSELLELAYAQESFDKLGAKLVVVSTDIMQQHKDWKASLEQVKYKDRNPVEINFPLVADNTMKISGKYGMIHSASNAKNNIRGVFFINPENEIRAIYFYPNEVGRNVEELQRTLLALQANYEDNSLVSPANWVQGEDMMVPVLSSEDKESIGESTSDYYSIAWFMNFKKNLK